MWGNIDGAYSLTRSHPLSSSLLSITGPEHIPLNDARWHELLIHYDILVHLHNNNNHGSSSSSSLSTSSHTNDEDENNDDDDDNIVERACRRAAKYCRSSSNLATLTLHVARMIDELKTSLITIMELGLLSSNHNNNNNNNNHNSSNNDGEAEYMKLRTSIVGKARVTCGGVNLLRLLSHETIVTAIFNHHHQRGGGDEYGENSNSSIHYRSQSAAASASSGNNNNDANYILKECFTYRSRGADLYGGKSSDVIIYPKDAAMEIIISIMNLFSSIGTFLHDEHNNNDNDDRDDKDDGKEKVERILNIPEVYDVMVQLCLLLLVLFSTQLYQPFPNATMMINERQCYNYFLDKWMQYSQQQQSDNSSSGSGSGTKIEHQRQYQTQNFGSSHDDYDDDDGKHGRSLPRTSNESLYFLQLCIHLWVQCPTPPKRSISFHYVELTNTMVTEKNGTTSMMKLSRDGMYESHTIVMARSPPSNNHVNLSVKAAMKQTIPGNSNESSSNSTTNSFVIALGTDDDVDLSSHGHIAGNVVTAWDNDGLSSNLLSHPLRNLLLLSLSKFLLLPLQLVRLAFRQILIGQNNENDRNSSIITSEKDELILQQLQSHCERQTSWSKTNNILWLTNSPLSDMACALLLIVTNNYRAEDNDGNNNAAVQQNPFTKELALLNDTHHNIGIGNSNRIKTEKLMVFPQSLLSKVTINFELLFNAFQRTAHTEIGALWLYTLLLSSPSFAQSIRSRSDLDTIILPLLRSLYFSIAPPMSAASQHNAHTVTTTVMIPISSDRPFRSLSQLYVILILLLIFSQENTFGRDSFRRMRIPSNNAILWFKERQQMKDASLGTVILLILLQTITYNLNHLHDEFILSNTCAVLLNLSPHITDLSDSYVATRLIIATVSCFKRYTALMQENGGESEFEGDISTLLGMHGEVSVC